MDRATKSAFVEELKGRFERAPAVYLTDFTGLDVKEMTRLRRELKASGGEYMVVKNRLVKLSIAEAGLPDLSAGLTGPTGLVFGYKDAVTTAKALREFAKEHHERPTFKLGILDSSLLTADEIEAIAKLPPREVLLSQLAGVLEAPLAALVAALEGKLIEAVGLLESLIEKRNETEAA